MKDVKLLYIMLVKNVCGSFKFIQMTRIKTRVDKTRDSYAYSIDEKVLCYHSELLKHRCSNITKMA
jgi:hypothetical protein